MSLSYTPPHHVRFPQAIFAPFREFETSEEGLEQGCSCGSTALSPSLGFPSNHSVCHTEARASQGAHHLGRFGRIAKDDTVPMWSSRFCL
jgi:hypothetical protein